VAEAQAIEWLTSPSPEPDRTYAEMLPAKNYYMDKEEPPPYGSRSRPEPCFSPSAPEDRATIAAAAEEFRPQ
jgi:hypothetical protein